MANDQTPPTPSSPKPGADWVPTQDGQGWVPANHPLAWQAPAANPVAPAAPTTPTSPSAPSDGNKEATPSSGPLPVAWDPGRTVTTVVPDPWTPDGPSTAPGLPFDGPGKLPTPKGPDTPPPPAPTPAPGPSPTPGPTPSPEPPLAPPINNGPAGPVADIPLIPNTPQRSAEKTALIQQLMQRAGQSTVVDRNDPNIRPQSDAYSAQAERARKNYLGDYAEANDSANTGAMRGQERMTAEHMGQDVGKFESELLSRELTSRRQEIQSALDSLGGLLTNEEENGLKRELANLDATIERTKINTQNTQFFAGLNQDDKQFAQNLTQQDRFKGMDDTFRRMELAQNNTQFVAKLAQEGKLAELDNEFRKAQLSQQDSQFLMKLAQDGKFQEMEQEFRRLQLSQDDNQFVAKLAQEGRIAEMDDLFRQMQLMQQQSQFLDRLGFDVEDRKNYWDWLGRGNAPPAGGN